MPTKIFFMKGDITELAVDAIVNPARTDLVLEAGIAQAIRGKGGERIQEECERLGPTALGAAVVTTAGSLKAFYVVHAAAMNPEGEAVADSVQLATHNTLLRTEEKAFKSIAFPAIGAGAAGLPMEGCARIMLEEVLKHLKSRSSLERIYFVLEDDAALRVFEENYARLAAHPPAKVT